MVFPLNYTATALYIHQVLSRGGMMRGQKGESTLFNLATLSSELSNSVLTAANRNQKNARSDMQNCSWRRPSTPAVQSVSGTGKLTFQQFERGTEFQYAVIKFIPAWKWNWCEFIYLRPLPSPNPFVLVGMFFRRQQ